MTLTIDLTDITIIAYCERGFAVCIVKLPNPYVFHCSLLDLANAFAMVAAERRAAADYAI